MRITLSHCLTIQAERFPEKEAIIYKNRRISYIELDQEVSKVAAFLLSYGLSKNDRTAVYMEKSPEEAFSILGTNRAGGIFIDVNHLLKPPQVQHILMDSGARFLFTTHQRLNLLLPILNSCDALEIIILFGSGEVTGDLTSSVVEFDLWENDRYVAPSMVETDIGAIIYTSGSTGNPKGVVLSHRNLVAGAESVSAYLQNDQNDRILSVLPFSFDYGMNQLTCSIYTGATCVLMNYLFPNDILRLLEAESITGLGLIPPLWLQLLQKKWDQSRFPHWRYMTNTGGRLPESAVKEYRRRIPKTRIYLMYGLTEAFRGTYLDPNEVDKRPGSIGKAIPNAEILIINKDGHLCMPGEIGEIVQRGAHVALGYWNDIERTEQRFKLNPFAPSGLIDQEKVVFSGDYSKTDEEGFIYYVGRDDDMIKTLGHRVSPNEIEEVLYMNEKVSHAAAFGTKDEILGQSITIVVASKPGLIISKQEMLTHCQMNLPNYLVPKAVYIWEKLPLNPNGKIDRRSIVDSLRA